MLHKRHNSVVTLAVLLTLVGVSKPAKAFLLAQSDPASTTFTVPDKLPDNAAVRIAASDSANSINNSLKDSFTAKYPQAEVKIETQDSGAALKSVSDGRADLAAIGRNLTAEEKAEGFNAIPVSREKIAVVVSPGNPYNGNLTIGQFAQIFRGEITDWEEIGGTSGKIELIDLPDNNDTRQAFPNYPVFQTAEFSTGATATQLEQDSTEAAIEQLGENSISYAVANDVIDRDDVKIVTMHQTQPDDPRYPFSQPFNLVYQGTPSEAVKAYLGYATAEGGREVVANRIGSISTAATTAVASAANNATETENILGTAEPEAVANANLVEGVAESELDTDAENIEGDLESETVADANLEAGVADPNAIADTRVNSDVEDNEINTDLDGSGEVNADLDGSGEINTDLDGSGEINTDLDGSGEINTDLDDSGELNPEIEGSGEVLSADPEVVESDGEVVVPNDGVDGTDVAEKEGGKWWLLLIPLLAIPILGAMFLGGRKKSDREPAVDNVPPNLNTRNDINPGMPDGGVPPVGANVSADLGNTSNTVNNAAMGAAGLAAGGAALAGGAAASRRTTNASDIDLDDSITAEEIPSTPVTEFTGQETRLQTGDSQSELQNEDIDLERVEFDESLNSAAGINDVGSDFDRDVEIESTESVAERPDLIDAELDTDNSRSAANSNDGFNSDNLDAEAEGQEFLGDYVLPEEGRDISVANNLGVERGTEIADGATTDGTASEFLGEDEVADTAEIEVDLDESNLNPGLGDRPRDSTANLTGDIIEVEAANLDTETEVVDSNPDLDLNLDGETASELNVPDLDSDTNVDGTNAGNAVIAGGAALGGAAASGFFNRDEAQIDAVERIEPESNQDLDSNSELDLGDREEGTVNLTEDTLELDASEVGGTNVIDLRSEGESVPDADLDADINLDAETGLDLDSNTESNDGVITADRETNVIDLRPEGESVSNADLDADINLDAGTSLESDALNLDLDPNAESNNTVVESESSRDLDLDLSEVREDTSVNLMGGIGEVKTSNLDAGIDVTDSSQNTEIDLDDDTSELDLSSMDLNLDDESPANETATAADFELDLDDRSNDRSDNFAEDLDRSLDSDYNVDLENAATGATASESLTRDNEETTEIQEFEAFETSFNVSGDGQTSSFADNVVADAETTAIDDSSLQEMTLDSLTESEDIILDDGERTINASLEEISFDDVDSEEINLDEITLDDTEISLDSTSINDLTPSGRVEDVRLEDLGFADAEPAEPVLPDLEGEIAEREVTSDGDDMNNISQWLDSLETPNQDSDNISDWLDTLDRDGFDSDANLSDSNQETNTDFTEEEDDISFQFLEDLLDRDEDSNRN